MEVVEVLEVGITGGGGKKREKSEKERRKAKKKLTLDIILGVRVITLIIMHHLHDMQQIILAQPLQTFSQFLHIDLCLSSLLPLLAGSTLCGTPTVDGSSSWASGGITDGSALAQTVDEFGFGIAEGERVKGLVAFGAEVQIMEDCLFALGLGVWGQGDLHVEFAPALLGDAEGGFFLYCSDWEDCHVSLLFLLLADSGKWEGQGFCFFGR